MCDNGRHRKRHIYIFIISIAVGSMLSEFLRIIYYDLMQFSTKYNNIQSLSRCYNNIGYHRNIITDSE